MNILALIPDFYSKETGYSIACKNLYKTLIDNEVATTLLYVHRMTINLNIRAEYLQVSLGTREVEVYYSV